jgi:hypothetical protein
MSQLEFSGPARLLVLLAASMLLILGAWGVVYIADRWVIPELPIIDF